MDEFKKGYKSIIKESMETARRMLLSQKDTILLQFVKCYPNQFDSRINDVPNEVSLHRRTDLFYRRIRESFFENVYKDVTANLLRSLDIDVICNPHRIVGTEHLISFIYKDELYNVFLEEDFDQSGYCEDSPYFHEEDDEIEKSVKEYVHRANLVCASEWFYYFDDDRITHNIVVKADINQHDRWLTYIPAAIDYEKDMYRSAIKLVAKEKAEAVYESVTIMPYDRFMNLFFPEKTVEYLRKKQLELNTLYSELADSNHTGELAEKNKDAVITRYLLASNNFVGTLYATDAITEFASNDIFCKADNPEPPFATMQYHKLFSRISKSASSNIGYLERERVFKSLMSSEWMFTNLGAKDALDNTYVCFGYFKLIEILLSEILTSEYSGETMTINADGATVRISSGQEKYLMLGNMRNFLIHNPASPIHNIPEKNMIDEIFSLWTSQIRNGYFHKDIVSSEDVLKIRNITFELVYIILGTLPKTKE